jgi:hypothetical protein
MLKLPETRQQQFSVCPGNCSKQATAAAAPIIFFRAFFFTSGVNVMVGDFDLFSAEKLAIFFF